MRSKRRLSWVLVLGLLVGLGLGVRATGEEAKGKALPSDLALVPQQAQTLLSLRLGDLWKHEAVVQLRRDKGKELDELLQPMKQALGISSLADIERVTIVMAQPQGPEPFLFFVKTTRPYDRDKVLEALGPTRRQVKVGAKEYTVAGKRAVHFINEQAFVLAQPADVHTLLDSPASRKAGPLGKALTLAAGKHAAVLALNPAAFPDALRNNLPPQAAPFLPLLDMELGTLVVDVGRDIRGTARLTFANADQAKKGAMAVKALLPLMQKGLEQGIQELSKRPREAEHIVALLKQLQGILKEARVQHKGRVVGVNLVAKVHMTATVGAFLEMVHEARVAARRTSAANSLKQIGLAMHNYHDANGSFPPPAVYSAEGKALLSWRVLVLPYLGRNDLYQQFKLDEPWDSKHNKKLLAKMPAVFKPTVAGKAKPYHTFLQVLVGKGTVFEGKRGIQIRQIIDGTSNTIMVVEGSKAVPWTKPQDIPFDPTKAPPRLGGIFPDGFNATFCDGSVHFIRNTIKPATLRLLIQRNDGMPVPRDLD
jgi:hypothetical protein